MQEIMIFLWLAGWILLALYLLFILKKVTKAIDDPFQIYSYEVYREPPPEDT